MPASAARPVAVSGASLTPKGSAWPISAASTSAATMPLPASRPRKALGASRFCALGSQSSGAQASASTPLHHHGHPATGTTAARSATKPAARIGAETRLATEGATVPRIVRMRVSSTTVEAARKACAL